MGEGRGEGEYNTISLTYIPLSLIPYRQGRGNSIFCEAIRISITKYGTNFVGNYKESNIFWQKLTHL